MTITDKKEYQQRLANQRQAIAVMDYGIFVLANHGFVEKLGYDHFEQLESSNLLDHTVELDKAALREFLTQASHSDAIQKHLPQLSVNFRSADGHIFAAELSGYCTHLEGKDVIEIQMVTAEDRKLANRVRNLPWRLYLCLICLLAITVLPNAILPKLNINNAPTTFLPPDALSRQFYDHVRTIFPDDEVIILLFEGVALFSDGFLQAYDQLGVEIGNLEDVDDVIAITSQDHIEGTDEGFLISPLVDIEQLDETRPQARLQRAISDRFARNSLVAADGSAIAMVVIPVNLDNSILNLKLEESILQLVKEQQLDGYLSAVSGEITTDVAQMRMILQDNMTFIPLTVATGLLLTWLLFHRMLAVVITGVVTGAVVNTTTSLFVLFDQPFNSISSILPPLLSALTMAALVHVYNALQYTSLRGLNGRERVNAAMQEVKRPALYSALTTAIGLASLGFSSIPPIRMFGLSAALGVCLVYLIVIHLLPPILVQFDRKPWPRRQHGLQFLDQLVNVLVRTGIRHPVTVIAVVVLSLAASAPLIGRIKVETNLLEFFHADHPLRVDTAHIENKLAGTLPLEIVFTATDPDWLLEPAILQQIRLLQTGLERLASVDKTLSVADFIEEMNWGFHAEDPKYRTIPDDAKLISQYLFVYDGEDLFDFIDSDYLNARVAINANVHGAEEIRQLVQDVREQLRKRPGLLGADIKWEISGAGRLFADQEALLIDGQSKSLGGALVLIFLLLFASWRSLRDAALCMIPNLSPILLIFIVMGLLRINLDMATAMIASVAVGIAIDDTIHVYHGFIHRIKAGRSPVTALVRAYQTAGRAVMVTTFILCSQFLLLLASAFVPMGYFGLLSSIGLIAALVFDLLLLPAILILVFSYFPYKKKRSRHHQKHAEQFDDTL